MTKEEEDLLCMLHEIHSSNAFAMACDGNLRAPAHKLEELGLAEWKGTNWGSSFYAITDAGLRYAS